VTVLEFARTRPKAAAAAAPAPRLGEAEMSVCPRRDFRGSEERSGVQGVSGGSRAEPPARVAKRSDRSERTAQRPLHGASTELSDSARGHTDTEGER